MSHTEKLLGLIILTFCILLIFTTPVFPQTTNSIYSKPVVEFTCNGYKDTKKYIIFIWKDLKAVEHFSHGGATVIYVNDLKLLCNGDVDKKVFEAIKYYLFKIK